MKKLAPFVVLALAAGLAAPGCGTVIKETAGVALGAKGTFMPIHPVAADKNARPLGAYKRFEIGPITDDIAGKTPGNFLGLLPAAFRKQLEKAKLPDEPGGKTLLIRGKIIHYESSGTLGFALGPLEEVIVRTELVDKDSGNVLGLANCIGRTTERVNVGVDEKAEGLAKAFVKWIETRYPKEE
jgi:hypothetical protein